jgi:hypothetical protein
MRKTNENSISYQLVVQSARSLAAVAAVLISIAVFLESEAGVFSRAEANLAYLESLLQ